MSALVFSKYLIVLAWNIIHLCMVRTSSHTKITPNIKTAEWICRRESSHCSSSSTSLHKGAVDVTTTTAVNGIDRGVAIHRGLIYLTGGRASSTTSAGKARFPSSLHLPPLSYGTGQERCPVHVNMSYSEYCKLHDPHATKSAQ